MRHCTKFCKSWEEDCLGSLECVAGADRSTFEAVVGTMWNTRRGATNHWKICHPNVWENKTIQPRKLWKIMERVQPIREVMFGARFYSLHQNCRQQLAEGGPKLKRGWTRLTGKNYHKQPRVDSDFSPENVRRLVWIVVSAKLLSLNALLYAYTRGNALKTRRLLT